MTSAILDILCTFVVAYSQQFPPISGGVILGKAPETQEVRQLAIRKLPLSTSSSRRWRW